MVCRPDHSVVTSLHAASLAAAFVSYGLLADRVCDQLHRVSSCCFAKSALCMSDDMMHWQLQGHSCNSSRRAVRA